LRNEIWRRDVIPAQDLSTSLEVPDLCQGFYLAQSRVPYLSFIHQPLFLCALANLVTQFFYSEANTLEVYSLLTVSGKLSRKPSSRPSPIGIRRCWLGVWVF